MKKNTLTSLNFFRSGHGFGSEFSSCQYKEGNVIITWVTIFIYMIETLDAEDGKSDFFKH